jgi:hypothetical protein
MGSLSRPADDTQPPFSIGGRARAEALGFPLSDWYQQPMMVVLTVRKRTDVAGCLEWPLEVPVPPLPLHPRQGLERLTGLIHGPECLDPRSRKPRCQLIRARASLPYKLQST